MVDVGDAKEEEFPVLRTRDEWGESGTKVLPWKVMFCDAPQEIK